MSAAKDCFHPHLKENVTPHRLAVGILIREFCKMRGSSMFQFDCILNLFSCYFF